MPARQPKNTGKQSVNSWTWPGQIRKVLVIEVSCLGRRTADILQVIEELSDLRVSVYAHNFGQETLTKEGKRNPTINLVYTLLAEIARMETELLSECIRPGQAEARRKGKKLGRREGTTKPAEQLLKDYSGVVKDLNEDLSIRQTAAIRKVSKTRLSGLRRPCQALDLAGRLCQSAFPRSPELRHIDHLAIHHYSVLCTFLGRHPFGRSWSAGSAFAPRAGPW